MSITKPDPNDVTITFNIPALHDAIDIYSLNSGTVTNPIQADDFVVKISDTAFSVFNLGETIKFYFYPEEIKKQISFVFCKFENIGKNYVDNLHNPNREESLDSWHQIFKCNENITPAPDGSLYLAPDENNICTIEVSGNKGTIGDKPNYISYSILFSILHNQTIYYCKIDPIIEVQSEH